MLFANASWSDATQDAAGNNNNKNKVWLKHPHECVFFWNCLGSSWTRETWKKFEGLFKGSPQNFTEDDSDRVFSSAKSRLLDVKKKFDPSNLFGNTNNTLQQN